MHAGVASQKLAMPVSQKPAPRCLTLNEVPPKRSVDCGRHRFLQTLQVMRVRATKRAWPVLRTQRSLAS